MPTTTGTTTKTRQLWQLNCAPECGFYVRDHNEKGIIDLAKVHLKTTHPDKKMSDGEIKGMIKPA